MYTKHVSDYIHEKSKDFSKQDLPILKLIIRDPDKKSNTDNLAPIEHSPAQDQEYGAPSEF